MKDYKRFSSFWNAFRKAIPNFDETKCWMEKKDSLISGCDICFVWDGELNKLHMYCGDYYIDIWKNYFIEFFDTGNFDYNGYYELYESKDINPEDVGRMFKFPLCSFYGKKFYDHSKKISSFLREYRKNYPNCRIKRVPKPIKLN